jgi:amino acid adenylation domain-containing protein
VTPAVRDDVAAVRGSLGDLFEAQVESAPDEVAVELGGDRLTFSELDDAASALVAALELYGVGPDRVVALDLERSLELLVAVVGTLKAGGAFLPIDPSFPEARRRYMAEDAGAAVVVVGAAEGWAGGPTPVLSPPFELGESRGWTPVHERSAAYVIYTSGSTGRPKGVVVDRGNLAYLIRALAPIIDEPARNGAPRRRRFALNAPLVFDASVQALCRLVCGDTVVVVDDETRRDPRRFVELLADRSIDAFDCTPTHLRALVAHGLLELEQPLLAIVGGEAIDPDLWAALAASPGKRFVNVYGPTEGTVNATAAEIGAEVGAPHVGQALDGAEVHVLDDRGARAPVGVPGEIVIGGAGVTRGYVGAPGLTATRFVPDPFGPPGSRAYRTGDIGRARSDGGIEFVGRLDHQVKIRGHRIELGEIEATLRRVAGVRDAVVVTRAEGGEPRIVAYVVGPGDADTAALRTDAARELPAYMVPAAVVPIDTLPVTASGKVNRAALPAPSDLRPEVAVRYAEPRNETEELVVGVFGEILGVRGVGIDDNFFELGGHSLLATQAISRLVELSGSELRLQALFEHPTPAGLAAELGGPEAGVPPLVAADRSKPLPLSFAQQRLWFIDQLHGRSSEYTVVVGYRLTGTLDLDALRSAFDELVRRHEPMRTVFHDDGAGAPAQVVLSPTPVPIPVLRLATLAGPALEERIAQLVDAELAAAFDLARGPLFRVRLLQTRPDDHVMLLAFHHVVADAWSLRILLEELSAAYAAFAEGRPSPLRPLPVQYADFAVWQRAWLRGEVLERQLDYWRRRLDSAPPLLELRGQRPRPRVKSAAGAQEFFELDQPLVAALRELSRTAQATLYMTLLAAFNLLVAERAGRTDVTIGTAVANRSRRELERLVGFFVNMLVLRTDCSGDPSFIELLDRVREVALGGYAHQDTPFEALVDELAPERTLAHSPLCQVCFAYQNDTEPALVLPGIEAREVRVRQRTVRFDLVLTAREERDRVLLDVEYDTELYDRETVLELGRDYIALLRRVAGDPARRASELLA